MSMYRLTVNSSVVIRIDDGCSIPRGHRLWDDYEAWCAEGNAAEPLPAPTVEQRNNNIRDAAWQWMASVPQSRGYDSIESCCSYAQSSVARYKAEALAMIAWRDAVNQRLEALALNPPEGIETWEQAKVLLPQPDDFAWPQAVSLPLGETGPVELRD